MSLSWIMLLIAGLCEIVWAVAMKYSDGFSKLWPTVIMVIGYVASVVLLTKAVKGLPVGTAYAVWTGIGAFGTALFGIFLLNEPVNPLRIIFLSLLVISIIGLKFA